MRAEEWEEIKRTFESALNLSDAARAKFLDAACGDKPVLRQTVDELLRAHREASGFLDESTRQLPAVFQPGQLVAERFRIIRLISRGGMGEVYETFDERLSIRLALKTLRPEFASDVDALERFRREIRVSRDFGHPNLCRVYELVEHHPAPGESQAGSQVITCLTMQLMSGETLQQYRASVGPLSPAAALPLIRQMAGAIEALHDNGIIHRDLKPSNIMITPASDGDTRAIVMDFGLAKPFSRDQGFFESKSDFHAGAPFFLAPELVAGEKPSIASDIYALGLIIDEMVTEGGAFTGDTVEAILYQKLWGEPKDPRTRAPYLPPNWARTICRCLERDPATRFFCAADVVRELEDLSSLDTQPLPRINKKLRAPSAFPLRVRRRQSFSRMQALLGGAAILVVAIAVFLGFISSRPVNLSVLTFQFENLTGKAEYDYLCRGMTREVERRLMQIPGIQVVPYHAIRPKEANIRAKERFSVDGQLEVGKKAPRLSVSVIENSTGRLICCTNTFENNLADSLEMQGQIASSAVDAMRAAVLLPSSSESYGLPGVALLFWRNFPFNQAGRAGTAPTTSSAAMDLYMRANALYEQGGFPSLKQAADLYEKAIGEDPKFVLAYSSLARTERTLLDFNFVPRAQLLESAKSHALKAVTAGPGYGESYAALAFTNQYSWDWRAAEENYKRALATNPKLAYVHRWYGGLLVQFGRFDEGIGETRKSIALDPYDLFGRLFLGTYLHYAGKPEEAAATVERYLAERDFMVGHNILGYVYAQRALRAKGVERTRFLDRALKETDLVAQEDATYQKPEYAGVSVPMYALFYALRGDRQEALKYLNFLLAGEKAGAVNPIDIACSYVALGDRKDAMEVLKRGVEAKDGGLTYMKVEPFLAPLRSTVEFQALISQAGL